MGMPQTQESDVEAIELVIRNPSGLHARPAALFVKAASASRSQVRVANLDRDGAEADAKSILAVLGLGVSRGHHVRLTADGEDAAETLETLRRMVDEGLGETVEG